MDTQQVKKKLPSSHIFKLSRDRRFVKHDEITDFIIRARSEQQARQLASENCESEGPAVWHDKERVTVQLQAPAGKIGIILFRYLGYPPGNP